MRILISAEQFAQETAPCVLAAGFFDGMHIGHRCVIAEAFQEAQALGAETWALTFDQHPLGIVQPARRPPLLTPLPLRLERLAETGLDGCLMLPFTPELASLEPPAFIERLCGTKNRVRAICCGANWHFGHQGAGNPNALKQLAHRFGFVVRIIPEVRHGGRPISSSSIRRAIRTGDLHTATAMLGRPYSIRETVVRGHGRGRRLGLATANVHPVSEVLPPVGVYVVATRIEDRPIDGLANFGFRPTFESAQHSHPVLELHLLDFEGDLYGRALDIAFIARLRDERRFNQPADLVRQIREDIRRARASGLKGMPRPPLTVPAQSSPCSRAHPARITRS